MWIIPKQSTYFRFVRATEDLKSGFPEHYQEFLESLLWRSKPTLWRTWQQRLKKVSWLLRLCGLTLKPSQQKSFEDALTSSLRDTRVSRSVPPENDKEKTTPDTFGRILRESCRQYDLFDASSRMSPDTLPLDSQKFTEAYEIWVTKLRQDYLARENSVLTTKERDYLFLPTPRASDCDGGRVNTKLINGRFKVLRIRSNQWFGAHITDALTINQPNEVVVNPSWIEEEIMGVPTGWTDIGSWATESSRNVQKKRTDI